MRSNEGTWGGHLPFEGRPRRQVGPVRGRAFYGLTAGSLRLTERLARSFSDVLGVAAEAADANGDATDQSHEKGVDAAPTRLTANRCIC
jgi:hypothetical protein